MLSQGKELAAIDFAHIIGGPLEAVITAQGSAAKITTQFIKDTAFESEPTQEDQDPKHTGDKALKLKVVEFDYSQVMGKTEDDQHDDLTIKVPLLTLIPIPFIRVDNMTIDFNVVLHDYNVHDDVNTAHGGAKAHGEYLGVKFKTSVSDQNTFQDDKIVDDTYSLRVTVHAVQDQMPGGMSDVLGIFSSVIQQQSSLIQQIMSAQISAQTAKISAAQNQQQGVPNGSTLPPLPQGAPLPPGTEAPQS